jgi:hypothetical protein
MIHDVSKSVVCAKLPLHNLDYLGICLDPIAKRS